MQLRVRCPPGSFELDDTLARTAEALARAGRLDDTLLYFWAAVCRHEAAANAGDIGELDRCLALAGSLADALDQPTLRWVHTYHLASRALLAGDTDRLEELATAAFELGLATGQPDATTIFAGQMFVVAWHRGDAGDLVPTIEQFAADNPGMSFAQPLLAVAHAEGGRQNETLRNLERAAETNFAMPHDLFWSTGISAYAEAATVFGTSERTRHHSSICLSLSPTNAAQQAPRLPVRSADTWGVWPRFSAATRRPRSTLPNQRRSAERPTQTFMPSAPSCGGRRCSCGAEPQATVNGQRSCSYRHDRRLLLPDTVRWSKAPPSPSHWHRQPDDAESVDHRAAVSASGAAAVYAPSHLRGCPVGRGRADRPPGPRPLAGTVTRAGMPGWPSATAEPGVTGAG